MTLAQRKGHFAEPHYPPIQDFEALMPMADFLPQDQLELIVESCLQDARERSALIEEALRLADWVTIGKHAHDIKSMAGQIGANRLQHFADRLEEACKCVDGTKSEDLRAEDLVAELMQAAALTMEAYGPDRLADFFSDAYQQ